MGIVGGKWDKRVEEWMDRVQRIEHHDDVHRSLFKLRDVYLANEEKRKQKWEMKVFEAMDFDEEGGLERDGVETLLKGKRILDAYDGIETPLVTEERVDEVFRTFDTNGNGKIEHIEFLKWYAEA
jgi:Ca2+-binding EF-hand superfamily protein